MLFSTYVLYSVTKGRETTKRRGHLLFSPPLGGEDDSFEGPVHSVIRASVSQLLGASGGPGTGLGTQGTETVPYRLGSPSGGEARGRT